MNAWTLRAAFAAALLALFVGAPTASATTISVSETISDIGGELRSRDLRRTRVEDTTAFFETNDAVIVLENDVDDDFGIYNPRTVTYKHDLASWLSVAPAAYLDAELTIRAFGVDIGGDDVVIDEKFDIGDLMRDGALFRERFTTTVFPNASLTLALNDDGMIEVEIDKSFLDFISITDSTLTAHVTPVPEPSATLVFGLGALVVGRAVRRRR